MARKKLKAEAFPPDCAEIVANAIQNFEGQGTELESAIGMLYMGHAFGWKVLYVQHSVGTIKKYEERLGINVKERFPEFTEHSDRSAGYRVAKTLSNFWRVVRGVDHYDGARNKAIEML